MNDRVCLAAHKLSRHSECGKMYLWTARSWWNNAELLTDIFFCRSYILTYYSDFRFVFVLESASILKLLFESKSLFWVNRPLYKKRILSEKIDTLKLFEKREGMGSMSILIRWLVTEPPWKYWRSVWFHRSEVQPSSLAPYEIILTRDSSMKGQ